MPIPEERLYRPERIHRWFAVSSILMTVSILWMIWVDYDRPWRAVQDQYFVGKAALAHFAHLDALRQEKVNELEEARHRQRSAEELFAGTDAMRRDQLAKELADVDLAFRQANAPFSAKAQVLTVTRDEYERALNEHGPTHPTTKAAHVALLDQEREVEELQKRKEESEDRKRQLELQIKELEKPVREAQKRVKDIEQIAQAAMEMDRQYRGVLTDEGLFGGLPIVSAVINAPGLDFVAPKNTPGRHEVKQLVLPDVHQRLNYLESYTTDRCTTCHIGIDDPEFSRDQLARKLEAALPGINEAMQRMGKSPLDLPAPPIVEASGGGIPLQAGRVTEHWEELTRLQQEEYFDALLKAANTYLQASGRKTISLGQPLLAHPHLDLYLSIDSPHPMNKIGCTVCHEGNPQETDFVLAAHTPGTHKLREEWAEEHYVRRLGIPSTTFDTVAHYWDRPMLLPSYSEAGCAKCHQQISDIADYNGTRRGEKLNLGRELFTGVGCVNCHEVKSLAGSRRVGPDLSRAASKLTPGFIQQWMYFPQKFRPSTRMPHFFVQENNGPGSENAFDPNPVLRTEAEVASIAKYLTAVSKEWKPIPVASEVHGDVERGKQLFRTMGCLACHSNLAEFGEEWIAQDVARRKSVDETTARYQAKGMSHEERVRYAMEHFTDERETYLRPEKARFEPEKSAHHTPVFSRFAPELSGIGSKVTFEWLYSWLIDPTHYSPETKMPSLRLTPPEAADIASYLMTLRNDSFSQNEFAMDGSRQAMVDELVFILLSTQRSERQSRAIIQDAGGELTNMLVALLKGSLQEQPAYDLVSAMSHQDKKLVFLGSKMISHYGCYACHTIPGFEEATPPGTDLSAWAEKPLSQLDFANYDHAFHHMREEREDVFGHVYPIHNETLNYWSPGENPREQITHTHSAFAKHKMLNPRIWDREKIKRPYDKLKMPNFYVTNEEAEALTTFLLSRIPPRVNDVLKVNYGEDQAGPIAAGRNLTRELNCIGCHEIEDNAPTIQQYFGRSAGGKEFFDSLNAPPRLWGQGAKVQHNWMHRFFQHVEPLRPWLQIRMPSFHLTGEQATTLTEYFAALSQKDAKRLQKDIAPIKEYIAETEKAGPESEVDSMKRKSGKEDWHLQPALEGPARRLIEFAAERKLIREAEARRVGASPEQVTAAHQKAFDRSDFLRALYDVAYPFVEPARPLSDPRRFETGFAFFNDMGCLKCHVLGNMLPGPAGNTDDFVQMYRLDGVRGEGASAVAILNGVPYPAGSTIDGHTLISATNTYYDSGDMETKAVVEGKNKEGVVERVVLSAPSAPNLSLTYQRLRRTWVHDWMLQPGWIQPGTKMPQNFPDGKSPFEGDAKYPGTGMDHINLLVDFLYDAGYRGTRSPLPKSVAAAAAEFEEDGSSGKKEFED